MKKLLLVVEYQKDFVDGALGFPGAAELDAPIARKIARCRCPGEDVAFTLDTHGRPEAAGPPLPQRFGRLEALWRGRLPPEAEIVVVAACTSGPDPAISRLCA